MSQIAAIHARDKRRCWICTRGVTLLDASRDHVRPRSEGGYDKARNYRLAHRICNSARGVLPEAEVTRIRMAMWPCSTNALCQALRVANGEYFRTSHPARARQAPLRSHVKYARAKAAMKANRRAARARRRAEKNRTEVPRETC